MLVNSGLTMMNCKLMNLIIVDRKRANDEADLITPLDVKVELVIALVFLMIASAKSYMSDLRVINVSN